MATPLLYKLVDQPLWEEARKVEFWAGSADDLRDGFIHLSTREQLVGTLREHLAGKSSVLVLGVDLLGPDLHWEASRNGLLFPHWYAPLPRASIQLIKPIPIARRNPSGSRSAGFARASLKPTGCFVEGLLDLL